MKWLEEIDTQAGHILVILFVFAVGVGLVFFKPDVGTNVIVGAVSSLYTAMRIGGTNKQ